ncbi:uncharacterized protein LOC133762853 isoform X2 [Lepus europaeus]|uniref:uncharacterized protein LOC133762853 isoform X2 n=1 Tax=Lepus europaeus TaxID=9983 RepID=UPI002B49EA23|nr:uncharacterized protein LOC133762853 isoform X2 [Lepus europaeus]
MRAKCWGTPKTRAGWSGAGDRAGVAGQHRLKAELLERRLEGTQRKFQKVPPTVDGEDDSRGSPAALHALARCHGQLRRRKRGEREIRRRRESRLFWNRATGTSTDEPPHQQAAATQRSGPPATTEFLSKSSLSRGRCCGVAGKAACSASIPYGRWLESRLLHFRSSSLPWPGKAVEDGPRTWAPGFGSAQLWPLWLFGE